MPRTPHTIEQLLDQLKAAGSDANRDGMARFGIQTRQAFGVRMPDIRKIGRLVTKDHGLAQQLWETEIHEARILAGLIDHPKWVTRSQMDQWTNQFNSWDVCDQVCGNLFERTPFVEEKIFQWSDQQPEFVKRAAFALIAWHAVHAKSKPDAEFLKFFGAIGQHATDQRNFVKKAVNWALRQIGKRSAALYEPALSLACELAHHHDPTARWIGKDAVREFEQPKLRQKLGLTAHFDHPN